MGPPVDEVGIKPRSHPFVHIAHKAGGSRVATLDIVEKSEVFPLPQPGAGL
jgi:hypothetical protein